MISTSSITDEIQKEDCSLRINGQIPNFSFELGKKSRRDRLEIYAEILESCKRPCLKTQIMYKTNLSYMQLVCYLNLLKKQKLLELSQNPTACHVTAKGLEFLRRYSHLQELFNPLTCLPQRKH